MGTVGIPANYGGFETLAENIARYHQMNRLPGILAVYCSAPNYNQRPRTYLGAELRYLPFRANGISSIVYDAFSLISAIWHRSDVILLLGVSGAIALPLVRLVSRARVVTNVDGIEWKRQKWQGAAKSFCDCRSPSLSGSLMKSLPTTAESPSTLLSTMGVDVKS